MKYLFVLSLVASLIGCSFPGVKSGRGEKIVEYISGYICDLPPDARMFVRMDLEKNGITLKVDCDFEGRDTEG